MPALHLVVGPNGAGKTTFFEHVLAPATHLPLVNADLIANRHWPGDEERHGHEAAALAEKARDAALAARRSFVAETVFSHSSKLELIGRAQAQGYLVYLHVIGVPEALTLARTKLRSEQGGHSVPAEKVRARYRRLWPNVAKALVQVDEGALYDNSSAARPFRLVARYQNGQRLGDGDFPAWWPVTTRPRKPRPQA